MTISFERTRAAKKQGGYQLQRPNTSSGGNALVQFSLAVLVVALLMLGLKSHRKNFPLANSLSHMKLQENKPQLCVHLGISA